MAKYKDAISALIAEQVLDELRLEARRESEGMFSEAFTRARQDLDTAIDLLEQAAARLEHTQEAISVLMIRDEVSRETIDAMLAKERADVVG